MKNYGGENGGGLFQLQFNTIISRVKLYRGLHPVAARFQ